MIVKELKGFNSIRALNIYYSLLVGVKMLPAYQTETFEGFLQRVENLDARGREQVIRQGALIVQLEQEDVESIVSFCQDKNGISYSAANLDNLKPQELFEIIVAVCVEVSKIKIDFITESEKKNLEIVQ